MARRLETAVNVAILATCLAIVATLGQRAWTNAHPSTPPSLFRLGDTFPGFDGVDTTQVDRTLVMVVRHDCQYCADSVPFYRVLAAKVRSQGPAAGSQLVVVTTDDIETANRYVDENHIDVTRVVAVPPKDRAMLRVPGTPTLILLNRNRRIEKVWVGRLDQGGQKQVESAVVGIN